MPFLKTLDVMGAIKKPIKPRLINFRIKRKLTIAPHTLITDFERNEKI